MIWCRHHRRPGCIHCGRSIAIGVRKSDCTRRAPEIKEVLGFEARIQSIGLRNPQHRHTARILGKAAAVHRESTVVARQQVGRSFGVEAGAFQLVRAAHAAGGCSQTSTSLKSAA